MTLQEGIAGLHYQVENMSFPIQLERRLEALGLIKESKVLILQKKRKGAMIIKVRGTRFAIGHDISSNITVKVIVNAA